MPRNSLRNRKKVKVKVEEVTLPTIHPGPLNPHALFDEIDGYRVYPYALAGLERDRLSYKRKYICCSLENEYLTVKVLPDLGGRIWSIYDKNTGHDIIHKVERIAVQYMPGATQGGHYVGCGIEISYPDHHSITTARRREYSTQRNPDESATIIISEFELRYRTRWSMYLTLKPNIAALFQEMHIHNRTPFSTRFRYWGNCGVPTESENFEFIYPEHLAYEHGIEHGIASWPIFDGIDMRWHKNVKIPIGLCMKDVREGFYGYYDHDRDMGMVHWANPGEVPGKKYWTWGKGPHDFHRKEAMGDGKSFSEQQSGRMEDQEDFEIIPPFGSVRWTEIWYPISNLGGLSYATSQIAMYCKKNGLDKVSLKLQSPYKLDGLKISISNADNTVYHIKSLDLTPQKPKYIAFSLDKKVPFDTITVKIKNKCLLQYPLKKQDYYDNALERIVSLPSSLSESTPDQIIADCERMLRTSSYNRIKLETKLKDILKKDPAHGGANKLLGEIYLRQGLYDKAQKYLEKVLERRPHDGDAHGLLGLVNVYSNRLEEAYWNFWRGVRFGDYVRSYFMLGVLSAYNNRYEEACSMFRNCLDYNMDFTLGRIYLALMLNKIGENKNALIELEKAKRRDPAESLIKVTECILQYKRIDSIKSLHEQLHGDIQPYYEMAWDLAKIGFHKYALSLLKEAKRALRYGEGKGLIDYYIGYFEHSLEKVSEAKRYFISAQKRNRKMSFPFRLEEENIFKTALMYNSRDGVAHYYLGNLRASQARFKEARTEWQVALEDGVEDKYIYRNLANVIIKIDKDTDLAIEYLNRALKIDPNDVYIRSQLVSLCQSKNNFQMVESLLSHPTSITNRQLCSQLVDFLISMRKYNEAVDVITKKAKFPNSSQELDPIYKTALLTRARSYMEDGNYENAIKDLEQALRRNPNLGYSPTMKKVEPRIKYFLGLAYSKKGDRDKARKIWEEALKEQEFALWQGGGGGWTYGVWTDRYYQARILQELGLEHIAQVYLDALIAYACHKSPLWVNEKQRRELYQMAREGRIKADLSRLQPDMTYLETE